MPLAGIHELEYSRKHDYLVLKVKIDISNGKIMKIDHTHILTIPNRIQPYHITYPF